jgi:GH35 family endo-1,4-beta-xylanase
MKAHVHDRVFREVSTYRDRIGTWDIINEAHDWANCYEYSHDQLVELTRTAADAAREADPGCTRIVNSCCVFGEYVASGRGHQSKDARQLVAPYQYVDRLLRDGVGFEVVGLQLYYTGFDLFEHKRLFDRFARFGKPIHITEVAVPSAMGPDEKSHFKDPNAVRNMGIWRRPWDETVQADWVEGFYTICSAHPAVEAVTWWDFSDQPNHFFPHGGLLRESGEPKEAYHRLRDLLIKWGFEHVQE